MSLKTDKFVVITTVPNGKRAITAVPKTLDFGNIINQNVDMDIYGDDEIGWTRKRRRLTHLSPEEKLLRRKLKNRVAAQTARDRKKALMDELEEQLASLEEENKRLARENVELKAHSGILSQENNKLKEKLGVVAAVSIKTESGSHGSAVPLVPLPQGQIQALSLWMMQYTTSVIILRYVWEMSLIIHCIQFMEHKKCLLIIHCIQYMKHKKCLSIIHCIQYMEHESWWSGDSSIGILYDFQRSMGPADGRVHQKGL